MCDVKVKRRRKIKINIEKTSQLILATADILLQFNNKDNINMDTYMNNFMKFLYEQLDELYDHL